MPTSEGRMSGWVLIDDAHSAREGTLTVERDVEMIHGTHFRPVRDWTFVDAAGHFHAYDHENKTPTLVGRPRHVPCDGTCGGVCDGEGYEVIDQHCRICDEVIHPATVEDSTPIPVPGPVRWSVHVERFPGMYPPGLHAGLHVSVRFTDDAGEVLAFGIAEVEEMSISVLSGAMTLSFTLFGVGDLGRRGLRHAMGHATAD